MKICIDMGHTKASTGASGYFSELTEDRALGSRVIEELKRRGHTVDNSTAPDYMTYPQETNYRVDYENARSPYDLFVSIHFNAFDGNAHGTEVWYWNGDENGKAKAEKIAANICAAMGTYNRGAKACTGQYAVVRDTFSTAVLIETCFCDSKKDFDLYRACSYEKLVYAICNGIDGTNTQPVKTEPKNENTAPEKQETATEDHTAHNCECETLVNNAVKDFEKRLKAIEDKDLTAQIVDELIKRLTANA